MDLAQKEYITRVHFYPFSVQVTPSRGALQGGPSPTPQRGPVSTFCQPKGFHPFFHTETCLRKSKSSCLSSPPALLSVNSGKIKAAPWAWPGSKAMGLQALLKIATAQTSLLQLHCTGLKEPASHTCEAADDKHPGRTEPKLIRKSAGSPPPVREKETNGESAPQLCFGFAWGREHLRSRYPTS